MPVRTRVDEQHWGSVPVRFLGLHRTELDRDIIALPCPSLLHRWMLTVCRGNIPCQIDILPIPGEKISLLSPHLVAQGGDHGRRDGQGSWPFRDITVHCRHEPWQWAALGLGLVRWCLVARPVSGLHLGVCLWDPAPEFLIH